MVNDKPRTTAKPADPADGRRRAPCRTCGAWVAAGSGHVDPSLALHREFWVLTDSETGEVTYRPDVAADAGKETWTRWHSECDKLDAAQIIQRITGDETLSYAEAYSIARRVEDASLRAVEADREPCRDPWGYLTAVERAAIEEAHTAVLRLRSADGLVRAVQGACAWCGVSRSTSWVMPAATVLRWYDNQPAPLCSSCWNRYDAAGQPASRDEIEALAEAQMLGVRGIPIDWHSHGLKLFAEIDRDPRHRGHAAPWSYSPAALDVVRQRAYRDEPRRAPEPIRSRMLAERELYDIGVQAERLAELRRGELVW